tara:strand:- start:1875 stop:5870 length:3996 start_codon:yes stop_codon:yes gene_type:complete
MTYHYNKNITPAQTETISQLDTPQVSSDTSQVSSDIRSVYTDTINLGPEVPSKTISTTFGREEDYIELHIENTAEQLIYTETNFKDYELNDLSNNINLNPEKILSDRGYISGQYVLKLHLHRNKIFNSSHFPFQIKEISTSRREIKSITEGINNKLFDEAVISFILEIESSSYFKEFLLNFGEGILMSGINILLNKETLKHELILKTLDPLPSNINRETPFKIVEEISDPISINVNLGTPELTDNSIELMGPNFQIDTKQNNSIPSAFKTYNDILNYNVTSSYNHLLNKLENPDTINIQYDYIRNVSSSMEEIDRPFHFENFTHFSSAVERLKNFKYKLKLIELYDSQTTQTELIQGDITSSNTILTIKEAIKTNKRNIIKGLEGYEHFLYFTSGSYYTWPKSNSSPPYELYSITSSQVTTWLGDEKDTYTGYGGQLLSASLYDRENPYNLKKLIPSHILDNSNNKLYEDFVNMMGQHFDHIWAHIKHITEINNTDNKFGISKELVYFQLKSLGIDTFDQFENSNLIEYILGEGTQDNTVGNLIIGEYTVGSNTNAFYNVERGIKTFVTASNEGSIPKGQITKEIWKRLYNNSSYLLKTKGTERGLRALMNCYGIPSTILNVKEYGGSTLLSGPLKDLDTSGTYKTFSYDKSGLALKGESGTAGSFISTAWSSSLTDALSASAKTIEFRVKPTRLEDDANQHLFTLSGSREKEDPSLVLTTYTGLNISASNDTSQHGKIDLYINGSIVASTNNFPIYNGDFWNIYIGTSGTSASAADITFGAYQSNWLKHVSYYTASISQTEADRQVTFGDPFNGGNNIGGAGKAYFGGIPANDESEFDNIDTLRFSGSLQEIKYHFGELLTPNTLKKQTLEPFMYSGNTPSSSLETVVLRLPLGSNDQEDISSFHPNIEVNYLGGGTSSMASEAWEEVIETHHLPTPDTIGASMTSEKVRIDTGTIPTDNILLVDKKVETSTLDRQPPEYEDLGIFFSPTSEINEDIIYTLGSFRMDDYIGSPLPSAQSASIYGGLKDLQSIYNGKLRGRYNYWEYIKLIQNFDHTLFKLIEQFVPFKANTKTGLLIEPTFIERSKFQREVPIRSDGQTMTTGSHQTFEAHIETYNSGSKAFSFAPTLLYKPDGTGSFIDTEDPFATSSNIPTTIGQFEPGTYVVSNNNLTKVTSSKTSERLEQGTNGTIEIHEDYLDPSRRDPNAYNNQACQAPVRPFTNDPLLGYGIGFGVIGSSFIVGDWTQFGSNIATGIGFSAIGQNFTVSNYVGGINIFTIGTATIGSTFVVGTYSVIPRRDFNYIPHKSNVLLGNIIGGKKSKKYFKYQTYSL